MPPFDRVGPAQDRLGLEPQDHFGIGMHDDPVFLDRSHPAFVPPVQLTRLLRFRRPLGSLGFARPFLEAPGARIAPAASFNTARRLSSQLPCDIDRPLAPDRSAAALDRRS